MVYITSLPQWHTTHRDYNVFYSSLNPITVPYPTDDVSLTMYTDTIDRRTSIIVSYLKIKESLSPMSRIKIAAEAQMNGIAGASRTAA